MTDPTAIIADLERRLAGATRRLEEALHERDEALMKLREAMRQMDQLQDLYLHVYAELEELRGKR